MEENATWKGNDEAFGGSFEDDDMQDFEQLLQTTLAQTSHHLLKHVTAAEWSQAGFVLHRLVLMGYPSIQGDHQQLLLEIAERGITSVPFLQALWVLWKPITFDGTALTQATEPCLSWLLFGHSMLITLLRTNLLGQGKIGLETVFPLPLSSNTKNPSQRITQLVIEAPQSMLALLKIIPVEQALNINRSHPLLQAVSWAKNSQSHERVSRLASVYHLLRVLTEIVPLWLNSQSLIYSELHKGMVNLNRFLSEMNMDTPQDFQIIKSLLDATSKHTEIVRMALLTLAAICYPEPELDNYLKNSVVASRTYIHSMFAVKHLPLSQAAAHTRESSEMLLIPNTAVTFTVQMRTHVTTRQAYPFCEQLDLWPHGADTLYYRGIHIVNQHYYIQPLNNFAVNAVQFSLYSIFEAAKALALNFLAFKIESARKTVITNEPNSPNAAPPPTVQRKGRTQSESGPKKRKNQHDPV